MEVDEIESMLEKIWDLHNKPNKAIHSISWAQFVNSVKNSCKFTTSGESYFYRKNQAATSVEDSASNPGSGFVFMEEFWVEDDELALQEAKSLYAIWIALENLEDQLEFFHVSLDYMEIYQVYYFALIEIVKIRSKSSF